jgi:ubiquinone/menaquinone biosynthesis C-methylase UbiE
LTAPDRHPPDLFRGTARYYALFRPGYPPELIAHIVSSCGLDGTGRLLDLGCGTGHLALPLAPHVAEVVGMDPEPEMLAEAEQQARAAGVTNVIWLRGSSADLLAHAASLAPLRLTVIGRAFHWMDGDATLQTLDRLSAPDGAVVLTGDGCGLWNGTRPWEIAVRETIQRWLGVERRAGSGAYRHNVEPVEQVLGRSAFSVVEAWHMPVQRIWTIDTIVGYVYSTSFASPAVLGDRRGPFEADLRATLARCEPAGRFIEDVMVEAHSARRP